MNRVTGMQFASRENRQKDADGTRIRFNLRSYSMPLVSMRQLLDHAAENGYGLPAFNVNNLEQVQAIMAAADKVNAPVIMQASAGSKRRSSRIRIFRS
jgi:hypothetical protein